MAAASSRAARLLVVAVAIAAGALPALAQTATQGRGSIVVEPLPPIGDGETLAQPRFLRPPSAADDGRGTGGQETDGQDTGGQDTGGRETDGPAPQEGTPEWERSPDGRFHRAPPSLTDPAEDAPAPVVPIDPPATDLRAGAQLRELDKMTGQTKTFEIAVGETRDVERLRIELDACRSPEGNDLHGTMAFLKVWDTGKPRQDEVFSGWMFAESPSLSAIDHPRYDLWVISCTTSAEASSASRQ
jgi:hypothetical protein